MADRALLLLVLCCAVVTCVLALAGLILQLHRAGRMLEDAERRRRLAVRTVGELGAENLRLRELAQQRVVLVFRDGPLYWGESVNWN